MAEVVSSAISNHTINQIAICPLCRGIYYNPKFYDKLCSVCRKLFIWIKMD